MAPNLVPKPFIYITLVVITLGLIPPALIARARTRTQEQRRIHYIQDMDNQVRSNAQDPSRVFADGRAMRPRIDETVARGGLDTDDHMYRGVTGGAWATTVPAELPVNLAFVRRGEQRFDIYCQPCHGAAGYGDGIVHLRANELMDNPAISYGTQWTPPKNLHELELREKPIGEIYNTITNGIRQMAGYAAQIPVEDRWAIAAWVQVLQR
ncbi:MAG: c-type cytochrome, partial [Planctomycetota bacterium]